MERLNEIKDLKREYYCVSGWIRKESIIFIPSAIIKLCVSFYGFIGWSQNYKGQNITIQDNIITMMHPQGQYDAAYNRHKMQSICGQQIVKHDTHYWRFKILSIGTFDPILMIGIVQINKLNEKRLTKHMNERISPYLTNVVMFVVNRCKLEDKMTIRRKLVKYGHFGCRQNDIIEMCLDLNLKTLSYAINGNFQGIACKNIKHGKYKMVASISTGSILELLSFD